MKLRNGWVESAKRVPSPNYNARPEGVCLSLIVIHNISLPPGQYGGSCIEQFFQNCLSPDEDPYFEEIAGLEVSSHFLIKRDGELVQFVSCDDRAWHAGASCYEGRDNCNDFSIGIELEGQDCEPYEAEQYEVLQSLTHALITSYPGLNTKNITGHCDIAPGRKTDPGPAFDWFGFRESLSG
jgi:N-acetyl-anhydromuramoyl-L-alanine amidase